MSNISLNTATDGEVMRMLGERLRGLRESQGLTMSLAADEAGLARRTVYRAEQGQNPTLETVVRLLRLYGRINALAEFAPEPEASPMALIRRAGTRARG
ncbi:MAG: helix-turn-helix domain-containing protein [Planctomycetota bacterium]